MPLEVGDSRDDTLVVSSGISSDVSSGFSSGGAAGTPGVAEACLVGGRFWCLAVEDEDDGDGVRSQSPISLESDQKYRIASSEIRATSSSRYVKRINARKLQRMAALDLEVRDEFDWLARSPSPVISSPSVRMLKLPVLEPSTFLLKDFKPAEWISIHRQKKKLAHRCSSRNLRSMRSARSLSNRTNGRGFQTKANSCLDLTKIVDQRSVISGTGRATDFKNISRVGHKAQYTCVSVQAHIQNVHCRIKGLSGSDRGLRRMRFNLGFTTSSSRVSPRPLDEAGGAGSGRMSGNGERFQQGGSS
jgi:hypothetical protein